MTQPEFLEDLYQNQLQPKLQELDASRREIMIRNIVSFAMIVISIFVGLTLLQFSMIMAIMWGLLSIGLSVYSLVLIGRKYDQYRASFKQEVVNTIVHAIDPSWSYTPEGAISEAEYYSSKLFPKKYDRYQGDDLISGVIEKTDFRCSELHTEYKTHTTDQKGNSQTQWKTIFQGLFFHADFHKNFSGETFISPDYTKGFLGAIHQKFNKRRGNAKLVRLENEEFERYFAVHGTDQIEARYIMTPAMMEAFVRLKEKIGQKFYVSFVGNRVYCAFSFSKELFEPTIFKSIVKFADVESIYQLFKINQLIIHELNLNTRIWTKE